jgi:hypothetical protein
MMRLAEHHGSPSGEQAIHLRCPAGRSLTIHHSSQGLVQIISDAQKKTVCFGPMTTASDLSVLSFNSEGDLTKDAEQSALVEAQKVLSDLEAAINRGANPLRADRVELEFTICTLSKQLFELESVPQKLSHLSDLLSVLKSERGELASLEGLRFANAAVRWIRAQPLILLHAAADEVLIRLRCLVSQAERALP